MANTHSTRVRRYTGSQWDYLNPQTTIEQVVGLTGALADRVHVDLLGADEGIPTLDESGKILMGFLPEEALGGMKFRGTWSSTSLPTITEDYNGGEFWIVTSNLSITIPTGNTFKDEHGQVVTPAVLQAGDWLFFVDEIEGGVKLWSVVNNNQSNRYLNLAGGTLTGHLNVPNHRVTANQVKGIEIRVSNGLDPLVSRIIKFKAAGSNLDRLEVDGHAILTSENVNNYALDATTLNGQAPAYYRNADNINAGTLDESHIPDYISATSVDTLLLGKNRTFYGSSNPTGMITGDLWFDTSSE